ncbi:MAG TPA: hypothetical protein DIC42_01740 [Holosporales bacterium]|nr:hypothetical protein [Holosporales bacterium]
MSKKKNKDILESISKENYLRLTKEAIVASMLKQEVAGQRVFYVFLKQKGYKEITPESMDKHQSDGIVGNTIIECKLNENEGGGPKKAYQELYGIIPNRLKGKGERLPYYRIYVELETFLVEVYDCHCNLVDTFDWFSDSHKFDKYFNDKKNTYEYDLVDENVDLVEVIQNIYKVFPIKTKIEAYKHLQDGVVGWFQPFDFKHLNINRLILNNDKMNEKYVQKTEGAYFTPSQYVKISTQYVMNAIEQSKRDGYDDYVIVDRCAGVGNLESQFPEEVYPHLILGTINEAEALTANIRFNDLADVVVIDALTQNGVDYYKIEIEKYKTKNNVNKLAVIFLENPPYAQLNSNKDGGVNYKAKKKYIKTWVHKQMKNGGEDLDEQFVFSAYNYYSVYSYVHYGPIKIWKTNHLVNKEVKEAYLCNRKFFNAGESAIALIHWTNKEVFYETIEFDSDLGGKFPVHKVHKTISKLYNNDGKDNGICVVEARNFSFASPRLTGSLNDDERYGKKWVNKDNLLNALPLFCVCRDEIAEKGSISGEKDYRVIDTVYKTADGGTKYQKDKNFLQNCLLWSLCTHYNQCSTNSRIWNWGEEHLDESLKSNEIWLLYKELVSETGVNGLYNIEQYNKNGYGKLWREHTLYPKVIFLKKELQKFYVSKIRDDMFKYELLK